MTIVTTLPTLHESRLVLKDLQCFLQAINFGLTACFTLFVSFWLGDAAVFDLCIVIKHGRKFRVCGVPVTGEFTDALIQSFVFLGLVLHILRLHGVGKLIVLSGLLINSNGISLFSFLCGQVLGKIRLYYFQDVNDASTGTAGLAVSLWLCWLLHESIEATWLLQQCR